MILALRRGVTFQTTKYGISVPANGGAFECLREVAWALDYLEGPEEYNYACIHRPDEVRERLAAL